MTALLSVVEASGFHGANPADVHDVAETWLGHDLLVHTETTDKHARSIRAAGWHNLVRVGEILVGYQPDTVELLHSDSVRLTGIEWKVANVTRHGVTAARLRVRHKPSGTTGVVYGLHWPSGVFRFLIREKAHKATTRHLGRVVATGIERHPDWWRLVAGDTNLDHHRALIRRQFERELDLRDVWSVQPTGEGSHGKRLIDAMFTRRLHAVKAGVLDKTPASDHRAVWADFKVAR